MPGSGVDFKGIAKDFPEFAKADIDVFVEAFQQFDTDNSGNIDANELKNVLLFFGQGGSKEELSFLLKKFGNQQGVIDFRGFLTMMRSLFPWKRVEFLKTYWEPALSKYPEFTKDDLAIFLETFRDFDEDDSGSIDAIELGKVFAAMGQGCTPEQLGKLLRTFDADCSGDISWLEFLEMMRAFYPEKRLEYAMTYYYPARKYPEFSRGDIDAFVQAFRDFDADGSGSIDAEELITMFAYLGQKVDRKTVNGIITQYDTDGSGEIEFNEFLEIMTNFYPEKKKDFEKNFLEPAKAYTEFSKEDIEVFVECFREFDSEGNGSMNIHGLDKLFQSLGQGCTKQQLEAIIKKYDTDGNGTIEWIEFLEIMRGMYSGKLSEPSSPKTTTGLKTSSTSTSTSASLNNSSKSTGLNTSTGAPKTGGCPVCGKTVYEMDKLVYNGVAYHKLCMKCSECGVTLNLKTVKNVDGGLYCQSHAPKPKATTTGLGGNFTLNSQSSAPKVNLAAGVKKN